MCKLVLELGGDPHLRNNEGQTAAQSLEEEHPEVSEFLSSLTGETLGPASATSDMQAPAVSLSSLPPPLTQTEMTPVAFETAQLPEEVQELDPLSRAAAIETNNQAGALLARVQAILEETDRTGEDPDPRIREIVNEAVNSTMNAGRQLGETAASGQQPRTITGTALEEAGEKRQRRDDEPGR